MTALVIFYILMALTAVFGPALMAWTKVLDKSMSLLLLVFFLTFVPTIMFVGYSILSDKDPMVQMWAYALVFILSWEINHGIKLRLIGSRNAVTTC